MYSSIPSGSGAVAANAFAGSPPKATATGIGLPISRYFFPCRAPTLCSCQWRAASQGPITCIRYIPTFRSLVSGSSVITWGSVRKGPPSFGHVFNTGISPNPFPPSSTRCTTSWHEPLPVETGRACLNSSPLFKRSHACANPAGGLAFTRAPTSSPISSTVSRPSAIAIRFADPYPLIKTGNPYSLPPAPTGFSKSNAFPPPGLFDS